MDYLQSDYFIVPSPLNENINYYIYLFSCNWHFCKNVRENMKGSDREEKLNLIESMRMAETPVEFEILLVEFKRKFEGTENGDYFLKNYCNNKGANAVVSPPDQVTTCSEHFFFSSCSSF